MKQVKQRVFTLIAIMLAVMFLLPGKAYAATDIDPGAEAFYNEIATHPLTGQYCSSNPAYVNRCIQFPMLQGRGVALMYGQAVATGNTGYYEWYLTLPVEIDTNDGWVSSSGQLMMTRSGNTFSSNSGAVTIHKDTDGSLVLTFKNIEQANGDFYYSDSTRLDSSLYKNGLQLICGRQTEELPKHKFLLESNGYYISAVCDRGCGTTGAHSATLTLVTPNMDYTGSPYNRLGALAWSSEDAELPKIPAVVYYVKESNALTSYVEGADGMGGAPSKVGAYFVKITIDGVSATSEFLIEGDKEEPTTPPTVKPTPSSKPTTPTQKPIQNGDKVADNQVNAQITDTAGKTASYLAPAKAAKKITVPKTVQVGNTAYKIIKIADNAFKGNKKVTDIKLSANVSAIGKNAFRNCKNLKTITILSTKLTDKSLSKGAFSGISKNTVIKVPKAKLAAYQKLFKKKGLSSKVKIKSI